MEEEDSTQKEVVWKIGSGLTHVIMCFILVNITTKIYVKKLKLRT